MHQQEVDVVRAELLQALVGLADDAVVGEVARPDLGGQEDLTPIQTRILDAPAYLGLVAVHLGRIHVPVAHREGTLHGPRARVPREPVGPKTQRRNLLALYRLVLHRSLLKDRRSFAPNTF